MSAHVWGVSLKVPRVHGESLMVSVWYPPPDVHSASPHLSCQGFYSLLTCHTSNEFTVELLSSVSVYYNLSVNTHTHTHTLTHTEAHTHTHTPDCMKCFHMVLLLFCCLLLFAFAFVFVFLVVTLLLLLCACVRACVRVCVVVVCLFVCWGQGQSCFVFPFGRSIKASYLLNC